MPSFLKKLSLTVTGSFYVWHVSLLLRASARVSPSESITRRLLMGLPTLNNFSATKVHASSNWTFKAGHSSSWWQPAVKPTSVQTLLWNRTEFTLSILASFAFWCRARRKAGRRACSQHAETQQQRWRMGTILLPADGRVHDVQARLWTNEA